MRYTTKNVVAGFHGIKKRDIIPYSIARTLIEYEQLRSLVGTNRYGLAMEFGCGYGRMLPFLAEVAGTVIGYERDPDLRRVAKILNPLAGVSQYSDAYGPFRCDLVLTFTFLQHVNDNELEVWIERIVKAASKTIILCEQTDGDSRHCHGRSIEQYASLLPEFKLVRTEPRRVDPASVSNAHYMVFERVEGVKG